jgi:hypothetical protein
MMNSEKTEQSDAVESVVTRQPMQPLQKDKHGTVRFRGNAIVQHLLDNGGLDLNDLAVTSPEFPQQDWEQFAQLIGYSLSGFGDLSYVRDDTYDLASKMHRSRVDEKTARINVLEQKLRDAREHVKALATSLFRIHRDDLSE